MLMLFDIVVIIMVLTDIHNYNNQVTPLTIVAGGYTILININNLIANKIYSFSIIESRVLKYLILYFLVIFLIDMVFGCKYRLSLKYYTNDYTRFENLSLVMILFVIGVCAYAIQFLRLFIAYGFNIKGMNNGILGHLSSFAFIMAPVVFDLSIKSKKNINILIISFLCFVTLCISLAFGGKYVIFINLTYFLLYFVLRRDRRSNLKKLIIIMIPLLFFVVLVFIIIYYIMPIVTGQYDSSLDFAIEHMFYYLLGSVVSNNYTMSHLGEGNMMVSFSVLINIIKALFGDSNYINTLYPFVFRVSHKYVTNVSGFFGEISYNLGIGNGLLYVSVLFAYINTLLYKYMSKGDMYLSTCYSFAILVFLFFGDFFTVSGIVLPLLLAMIMDILSTCRIKEQLI